jgi:predicted nucleic acid-binding protein
MIILDTNVVAELMRPEPDDRVQPTSVHCSAGSLLCGP